MDRNDMTAAQLRAEADLIEEQEKIANELGKKILNKHTWDKWYVPHISRSTFLGHYCKCCEQQITNYTGKGWQVQNHKHSATCAVPEVERLLQYIEDCEERKYGGDYEPNG